MVRCQLVCANGSLTLYSLNVYPSKAINQLAWRPAVEDEVTGKLRMELAMVSEDSSVRIYRLQGCPTCLHKRALYIYCCGAPVSKLAKVIDESMQALQIVREKRLEESQQQADDLSEQEGTGLGIEGFSMTKRWHTDMASEQEVRRVSDPAWQQQLRSELSRQTYSPMSQRYEAKPTWHAARAA